MITDTDGRAIAFRAVANGVRPDPNLPVNEWADRYMILPTGKSAEPGPYRTDRTPYARQIMRRLSPGDPTKRVVVMGPSQLLKTQVALNFIGSIIHQAPGNLLVLLPTGNLAKRVSARISDMVALVPELRDRVAAPRSRDSRNTLDTKEFAGGTAYIVSAGSASNLAEIPARYVIGDEIDRWEANVDEEGDPVKLAEARTSTFEYNRKIYLVSSPTIEGLSRISELYDQGTRNQYWVQCPHCDTYQTLEWEVSLTGPDGGKLLGGVRWDHDDQPTKAWYVCPHCGTMIEEREKARFLPDREADGTAEWRAQQRGDGETESFRINALYAPLGFVSWLTLAREYLNAKKRLDQGDAEPMQVFYNTRLARTWDAAVERIKPDELRARAEPYPLNVVPCGGLALTAAVDTQINRLEVEVRAWGEGLESWVVNHVVLWGSPSEDDVWRRLDDLLRAPVLNYRGIEMRIVVCCIDSGGANTQDVYDYARHRGYRNVLAIKGRAQSNNIIASKPTKQDVSWRGTHVPDGVQLWIVGTDAGKSWVHERLPLTRGPGAMHFSKDLPDTYFEQLTAERKVLRYVKGHAKTEWVKRPGDRNEALDLAVYNLAAAHWLGLHAYSSTQWKGLRDKIDPDQGDLLAQPPRSTPAAEEADQTVPTPPASPDRPAPPAQPDPQPLLRPVRRRSASAYLSRRG